MIIIAKFSPQDAQRHARAFASKNNNSKEHQKTETESQDRKGNKSKESQNNNQTVKVIEAEDTGDLLAEIAPPSDISHYPSFY